MGDTRSPHRLAQKLLRVLLLLVTVSKAQAPSLEDSPPCVLLRHPRRRQLRLHHRLANTLRQSLWVGAVQSRRMTLLHPIVHDLARLDRVVQVPQVLAAAQVQADQAFADRASQGVASHPLLSTLVVRPVQVVRSLLGQMPLLELVAGAR